MAASALFDTVITKFLSSIFGKTHDESLEEMNRDAKKQQKEFAVNDLRNRLREANNKKFLAAQEPAVDNPQLAKTPEIVTPPLEVS